MSSATAADASPQPDGTLFALVSEDRPGMYEIAWRPGYAPHSNPVVILWREARGRVRPDDYYFIATSTFEHWCSRNGYPSGQLD